MVEEAPTEVAVKGDTPAAAAQGAPAATQGSPTVAGPMAGTELP
jgi:hypothetical protein